MTLSRLRLAYWGTLIASLLAGTLRRTLGFATAGVLGAGLCWYSFNLLWLGESALAWHWRVLIGGLTLVWFVASGLVGGAALGLLDTAWSRFQELERGVTWLLGQITGLVQARFADATATIPVPQLDDEVDGANRSLTEAAGREWPRWSLIGIPARLLLRAALGSINFAVRWRLLGLLPGGQTVLRVADLPQCLQETIRSQVLDRLRNVLLIYTGQVCLGTVLAFAGPFLILWWLL